MNMSALRLSTQLFCAFAIMVAISMVMAAVGAYELHRVNDDARDVADNWLPSVRALARVQEGAGKIRRQQLQEPLAQTPAERTANELKLSEAWTALRKDEQAYTSFISTDAEKKAFEQLQQYGQAFRAVEGKLLTASKEGRVEEVTNLLRQDARKAYYDYHDQVDRLIAINEQGATESVARAQASYSFAMTFLLVMGGVGVAVAVALATFILRHVRQLLGGDPLDAARAAQEIAKGNLGVRLATGASQPEGLMLALANMQQSLSQIVRSVGQSSEAVAEASSQIAAGNSDLSHRTEQQAAALQETTATMLQLGSAVRDTAVSAKEASGLVAVASQVAKEGTGIFGDVVSTMRGISDSSKRIADIINVIDGIAFQTNILALNAAVESARAGEQGRGFAVVASEVRTLAQRSATAAKEIKQLIGESVEKVSVGNSLVDQASHSMAQIDEAITNVTAVVAQIAEANQSQAGGVQQISEALGQIDQATQQNAALVEEAAAAAESLRQQSTGMVKTMSVFRFA